MTVKPTTTFPWWSQTCQQPNTRPKLWATGSDVWKQNYEKRFNQSRKDWRGDLQVRQTSLHLAWWYHLQQFLLPRIQQNPTSKKSGGKHNLFTHFPKDTICEVCRRTKVTRAQCRRSPDERADRMKIVERCGDHDNSRPHGSRRRTRIWTASQICSGRARPGDATDPKISMENPIIEISEISNFRRKPKIQLNRRFFGMNYRLTRPKLESREINAAQIRNTWNCRWSVTAISEMCKTQWQMGRRRMNGGSIHHLRGWALHVERK